MIAGQLELIMSANLARLASDMSAAKGIVVGATAQMESAVASLKSALGALGVGLSVGYFAHLIKGSVDAMDHLNDLNKTTSIAVETLAGLKVAAKQSGGDLDSIAASVNKLSVEMGKSPEKFRALGVSAKDPLESFKQLADIFTKLEDPQQRAAVMAAALGKSWAGAAPLLAEGGKKIGEMVERGSKLSGITEDMARQADELNDKLVLLVGTGGLLTKVVAPLLPLFNAMADDMLKAAEKSKGLSDSFSPLLEVMKTVVVLGANVAFTFDTIGKEIARIGGISSIIVGATNPLKMAVSPVWGLTDAFKKTESIRATINSEFAADAAARRKEVDDYSARIMGIGKPGALGGPVAPGGAMDMGGSGGIFGRSDAAAAAARAARFLGGDEAKDRADREQQIRDILHKVREHEDELELAQIALQNKKREEMDQQALQARFDLIDSEEAAAIAHGAELIAIDEMVAENKRRLQDEQLAATYSFLGDLSSLMNTQSRKAFEVGKVASIATAVVKGYEAAVSSYAKGAQIGGPYLGAAFAAASILATANLINNIRSQSFGGGGGGGGALGGAPVSTTQGASNFTAQQHQTPVPASVVLNLTVNGHILDTQEFTDTILVPALKDAIDNRDVKIIGANSRQAADLVS